MAHHLSIGDLCFQVALYVPFELCPSAAPTSVHSFVLSALSCVLVLPHGGIYGAAQRGEID